MAQVFLCFLFFLSFAIWPEAATSTKTSFSRKSLGMQEINKQLDSINKQPVKSIESPDGDVIDCILINEQPAFDHALLKNHKIQARPESWPGMETESNTETAEEAETITQLWQQTGSCPTGTVPIRRTKKEDILRAGSFSRYGKKTQAPVNPHNTKSNVPTSRRTTPPNAGSSGGHEHAIAYVAGSQFYGAQASLNVWKPSIQTLSEFSLSQMWVLGGPFYGDLNSIEAGWQVSPQLYGDSNPRLFTYWTTDAYQTTGCYNLLCSGFIQLGSRIAIGATIAPLSSLDGPQYDIKILVWKDPRTGNWWMRFGQSTLIGYWPAILFSHLGDHASMIEWGGEIVNTQPNGQHTSTQMGSGHFPSQGFAEASYFRSLGFVDSSNELRTQFPLQTLAEHPNCYDIKMANNAEWGSYFYYGGPGRNPQCR